MMTKSTSPSLTAISVTPVPSRRLISACWSLPGGGARVMRRRFAGGRPSGTGWSSRPGQFPVGGPCGRYRSDAAGARSPARPCLHWRPASRGRQPTSGSGLVRHDSPRSRQSSAGSPAKSAGIPHPAPGCLRGPAAGLTPIACRDPRDSNRIGPGQPAGRHREQAGSARRAFSPQLRHKLHAD